MSLVGASNEAVLGTLTYPRPNLKDWTLDDNHLERDCPLDVGRHHLDPEYDLGSLERLPLELLSAILVQLDIRSLMDFRPVNQRAMQVVDSIPRFRTIVKHSPASLRGVLTVGMGSQISCQDLFHTLVSPMCEHCEDFGGFIYILSCSRVCFLCFTEQPKYLPLLASEVCRTFGLDRSFLPSLIGMKSVPGCYSPNERTCRNRLFLIDPESARHAGIAFYGSASQMKHHVSEAASKRLEDYQNRVARIAAGDPGPSPRRPPPDIARDGQSSNPRRFMAVVRAPWIDLSTSSAEWGFHCVGCERQYRERPLHWRRKYTADSFDDHIKQCGRIDNGIHYLPTGMV